MLSWARPLLKASLALAELPSKQALLTKYVPLGLLAVLLAASLFKAVRVWGEIHDVEAPDSASDLLASFEQAHAEGALDDAELTRVREQLRDMRIRPGEPAEIATIAAGMTGRSGLAVRLSATEPSPSAHIDIFARSQERMGLMPVLDSRMNLRNSATSLTDPRVDSISSRAAFCAIPSR